MAQFIDQNKHAPIISFSEFPIVADMLRRFAASASISVTDLNIAAVSQAVILFHIKPFIDEALNAFYIENQGGRLSNSLRACLIDTSEDRMVPFTCIMKSIHRVYRQLSEETIRIVFKKQTVFASNVML